MNPRPRSPGTPATLIISVAAVVLAIVRALPSMQDWRIDEVTVALLAIPVLVAIMRESRKLKIGTDGVEFEQLEEQLAKVRSASEAAKSATEATQVEVKRVERQSDDIKLAVLHKVGGRAIEATRRALRAADASDQDDDPHKGKWGGKAEQNGRRLSARLAPIDGTEFLRVTMTVHSIDDRRPLAGTVVFHLHPTFRRSRVTVPVSDGVATIERVAYGAFTVGAEADDGATRLELDLAELPEAPEPFKSR